MGKSIVYCIAGFYRKAGMERVLAQKANALVAMGYEVSIVTTDQRGQAPAFELSPKVHLYDLGVNYELNNDALFLKKVCQYPFKLHKHFYALRRLLRDLNSDITVSMFCNDAAFLPFIRFGGRKVLEYHFTRHKRLLYGRSGLWRLADRLRDFTDSLVVRRFEHFVVLTKEDREYWGDCRNISVIPNPRTFTFDGPSDMENRMVLAAGRYSYQKGLDRLVVAWKMLGDKTEGWVLRIAGDGEESLGDLPANVLTGPSSDIKAEYMKASVFALSSRYEGLPMVLLEAQAAGLPIVSFACPCGPKDVVTEGIDGFMVPEGDICALSSRLGQLISDIELRKNMSREAFLASERFDENRIMKLWTELFERL